MKGFLTKPGIAGALLGLHGALTGCLWVDEHVPEQVIVNPVAYEPTPVTPETVGGFDGYRLPTTAVIRSFLGGADFRIAITLPDETAGVYVLEPGEPDQPPRILRYSNGRETIIGSKASWYASCALSPEGDRLAYSLVGAGGQAGIPSTVWMLNLAASPAMRVPLFSYRNRSYGMYGDRPYWHIAGGRSYIGFLGGSLQGNAREPLPPPVGGMESQMVEVLSDSVLSPVFPVRVEGERVVEEIRGISRDSQWVMLRESTGKTLLLPAARVPDLSDLRADDSLPRFFAGNGASLNPFDSGSSPHSDFHATPGFLVSEISGNRVDTILDPKTLDGRRMTASHPLAADNFWVCDAERRIHFSRKVGRQPLEGVGWTTHPNFVLARESFTNIYLVRLAGSKTEVLDGPEDETRQADGVLKLFAEDMAAWTGLAVQDISMWIQQ